MTLTLTDHCSMTVLPFHEGSKDDKVGLKICFFLLPSSIFGSAIFLVYTRTRFCLLCKSIQRGYFLTFIFFLLVDSLPPIHVFFPLLFLWFCTCFGRHLGEHGSMCAEGENKTSGSTFTAKVRE